MNVERRNATVKSSAAFSLVELSIVLVILGLLVGGILSGQALIKAASLRKTLAWNTGMQTTFMTFRDKYQALPGDMPNATSFWNRSTAAGVCTSDPGTASATGTCNGNGDGYIGWNGGPPGENYLVWHHLYLSGLDPYGQTMGQSGGWAVYIPAPAQSKATINFIGGGGTGYAALYPGATPNGTLVKGVGMQTAALCAGPFQATAEPTDIWQMDMKSDDGMPTTGNVIAWNGYLSDCTTFASGAGACLAGSAPNYTYNVTNSAVACDYLFLLLKG
ncbi:MAG: type II secretion system protein [Rickettsiales bacterium]